jgi:hypothetical protein
MRKLLAAALLVGATFSANLAQGTTNNSQNSSEIPNMGHAPKEMNGIGRLDLRVLDQNGNPIRGAYAKLKSKRSDGFLCESWGSTDARGVIALPPLHMGMLRLKVEAKGYQSQEIEVPADSLSQPVRVTLAAKK